MMKVTLHFHHTMKFALQEDCAHFELNDGSTLADLLDAFAIYAEAKPPFGLWNSTLKKFRGPVVLCSDNATLQKGQSLYDGQHIEIKRIVAGG